MDNWLDLKPILSWVVWIKDFMYSETERGGGWAVRPHGVGWMFMLSIPALLGFNINAVPLSSVLRVSDKYTSSPRAARNDICNSR